MVDRECGGAPVAVTMTTMAESLSPCGCVLQEGVLGEEEWVARLWARWIGRWRCSGGTVHGEARGGALRARQRMGQSKGKRMSSEGGRPWCMASS
jgi:hypothetical protein